ncbi:MAG: hypothetical protein Kow0077_04880 [Anaerolineae bacterium]
MLARVWWALVGLGFRLLYNELAWTYDWVSWIVSLGDWRDWQRAALPFLDLPDGGPVLELAYGTGNLQLDLLAAGHAAFGIDRSRQMGRISQAKLRRAGQPVRLVQAEAGCLPFPDATFSCVVSTFPTDFILQASVVSEVMRVLKPGGRLVVVYNGVLTGGGIVSRLLEWAYRITGQRDGGFPSPQAIFGTQGMRVTQHRVVLARSEAWLFVAEKLEN